MRTISSWDSIGAIACWSSSVNWWGSVWVSLNLSVLDISSFDGNLITKVILLSFDTLSEWLLFLLSVGNISALDGNLITIVILLTFEACNESNSDSCTLLVVGDLVSLDGVVLSELELLSFETFSEALGNVDFIVLAEIKNVLVDSILLTEATDEASLDKASRDWACSFVKWENLS